MTENYLIEYKCELTDSLEKEVVAFLNYKDGGVIYIVIDNQGQVHGVEGCAFVNSYYTVLPSSVITLCTRQNLRADLKKLI